MAIVQADALNLLVAQGLRTQKHKPLPMFRGLHRVVSELKRQDEVYQQLKG